MSFKSAWATEWDEVSKGKNQTKTKPTRKKKNKTKPKNKKEKENGDNLWILTFLIYSSAVPSPSNSWIFSSLPETRLVCGSQFCCNIPSPTPRQTQTYLLSLWICFFSIFFHMMEHMAKWVWLFFFSFSTKFSRFVHIVLCKTIKNPACHWMWLVATPIIQALRRDRQEGQESKARLSRMVSLRLTWAIGNSPSSLSTHPQVTSRQTQSVSSVWSINAFDKGQELSSLTP